MSWNETGEPKKLCDLYFRVALYYPKPMWWRKLLSESSVSQIAFNTQSDTQNRLCYWVKKSTFDWILIFFTMLSEWYSSMESLTTLASLNNMNNATILKEPILSETHDIIRKLQIHFIIHKEKSFRCINHSNWDAHKIVQIRWELWTQAAFGIANSALNYSLSFVARENGTKGLRTLFTIINSISFMIV